MFKTRLISGIVLVVAALILIITGGEVLLVSACAVSLVGMYELYRVYHMERTVMATIGYLAAMLFYLDLYVNWIPEPMLFVIGFLIVLLAVYVLWYPRYHASQVTAVFFVLCGGDAFQRVSDKNDGAGSVYRMADLFMLLGMRYVRVLCRRKTGKT